MTAFAPDEGKLSYLHKGGDQPLLGATIPAQFAQIAKQYPTRNAIVSCHQDRRLSYQELSQDIDQAAKSLLALDYRRGDRIGVWATDNIEWLVLQMATARIGAILVNINPAYRPRELEYALQTSNVQGLFTIPSFSHSNYPEMLVELIPELKKQASTLTSAAFPDLKRIVLYDPLKPKQTVAPEAGFLVWQDFLELGKGVSDTKLNEATASLDCDDPINIQYTSGTTGFPKAVVLTHHNILNNAYFTAGIMHFDETDRLCVPVPFYHCFGMVVSNLVCLSVGACIIVPAEHFDPLAVLQAIEKERCTALHGVPTMFIGELEHPRFSEFTHRYHGRRPLPARTDETGYERYALPGNINRLWPNRGFPTYSFDPYRRQREAKS